MSAHESGVLWAGLFVSVNRMDGRNEHLLHENLLPVLRHSRCEMRAYIRERYGYIRRRPDLRGEPHGWRVPRAIKVKVVSL